MSHGRLRYALNVDFYFEFIIQFEIQIICLDDFITLSIVFEIRFKNDIIHNEYIFPFFLNKKTVDLRLLTNLYTIGKILHVLHRHIFNYIVTYPITY